MGTNLAVPIIINGKVCRAGKIWGLGLHPQLLDDRHARRSTLVTSQLPVDHWHAYLGDPTLADAILDRLVHNAYRLHLKGDSLRKTRTPLTATPVSQ
ncbi:hypothetical protein BN873_p60015 [Candidatus Competibacter denitrificans Run_A_D11]|uniref:IstB-like ATP-binding domain-containing protein n=1 Tax=Candidatus Competibacter denitrificans Run_A_D11 TaxID=1400863 RepID=W6MD96_9GAMM|nr:hypothetical protein BN873_p60015 [Candidatus Competibacter denitrificans Run_A_D11]HCK79864.1 hypothetical protein [Candidatus Competibacteraceae bacterium]